MNCVWLEQRVGTDLPPLPHVLLLAFLGIPLPLIAQEEVSYDLDRWYRPFTSFAHLRKGHPTASLNCHSTCKGPLSSDGSMVLSLES